MLSFPITQLFTYFKLEATGLRNFGMRRIAMFPAFLKEGVKIDPAGSLINTSDGLDLNKNASNNCRAATTLLMTLDI